MRLFCGIEIGETWYNHASLKPIDEIKGKLISAFDNTELTTGRIVEEMCSLAVDRVYPHIPGDPSKADEEMGVALTPAQILELKMDDGFSIGFELIKGLKRDEYFTFSESFRCDMCSRVRESYTTVEESWQRLIDDGFIEVVYLDSPEGLKWEHSLPVLVQFSESGQMKGMTIDKITREKLSIYQVKQIQSDAEFDTPIKRSFAYIDQSICAIPGFAPKDLNVYVKRNLRSSFARKYLSHYDNLEELQKTPIVGFNGDYRHVACKDCGREIGREVSGGLDFTNFFECLIPRRSRRNLTESI